MIVVNIPDQGVVVMTGETGAFRLRCTVKGCKFRALRKWYVIAQTLGFAHAAVHAFHEDRYDD